MRGALLNRIGHFFSPSRRSTTPKVQKVSAMERATQGLRRLLLGGTYVPTVVPMLPAPSLNPFAEFGGVAGPRRSQGRSRNSVSGRWRVDVLCGCYTAKKSPEASVSSRSGRMGCLLFLPTARFPMERQRECLGGTAGLADLSSAAARAVQTFPTSPHRRQEVGLERRSG